MQLIATAVTATILLCPIQYAVENNPDITEHNGAIYKDLGEFKITYYNGDDSALEGGSKNCLGEDLQEGMIAVDPDVIPLGSRVLIDGVEYRACDVGGAIKSKHIDIYRDVEDVNLLGIDYMNVRIEF